MEISNSKRCLGLMFTMLLGTCFFVTACSSDENQLFTTENKDGSIISLSNGETLLLSDTTTYELEFDEALAIGTNSHCEDSFSSQTRASSPTQLDYEFDYEEPESDWRKYSLGSSWSQYGISSGIYIARYIKVHKNLSIQPNKSIIARRYDSPNAPENAMGWKGTTKTIGFTASPSNDSIADGVTRVFYINCNLSGVSYNKYIPAVPTNFVWGYILEDEDDW